MTVSEHPSTLISSEHHNDSNNSKLAKNTWKVTAALKRDDRANRLKPYAHWGLAELAPPSSQKNITSLVHTRLTDRERSFLAIDATDLAQRLASRDCTALEVTTAFCKAAYVAQELTNCLTEVMFDQALARARELDTHISATGKVVGPLHGVPVSIKNHIAVKAEDTATGFVAWAGRKIAEEDATIVQILRQAGAIIYVKTTNPQALFALKTRSNIYGSTSNPYNRELGCGGSSGGEGALIASRGSLLGVGTDIGGSIPWSFDFGTLSVPWNSSVTQRKEGNKLVIGFFTNDGVVAPHPPIIERLHKTQDALIAAGHEVVDWVPMDHMQAFKLIAELFFLDGGEAIHAVLAELGEPAIPPLARHLPDSKEADTHTLAKILGSQRPTQPVPSMCIETLEQHRTAV
ncbi:Amidase, partial [Rhizoctonia solani]